jgi:Rad3-related DNA helicase
MADARPLLVHGEESRDLLLEKFRVSGRAVLIGTSSYWEGVDVPGRALRGLLIARLPFRVPTEPSPLQIAKQFWNVAAIHLWNTWCRTLHSG